MGDESYRWSDDHHLFDSTSSIMGGNYHANCDDGNAGAGAHAGADADADADGAPTMNKRLADDDQHHPSSSGPSNHHLKKLKMMYERTNYYQNNIVSSSEELSFIDPQTWVLDDLVFLLPDEEECIPPSTDDHHSSTTATRRGYDDENNPNTAGAVCVTPNNTICSVVGKVLVDELVMRGKDDPYNNYPPLPVITHSSPVLPQRSSGGSADNCWLFQNDNDPEKTSIPAPARSLVALESEQARQQEPAYPISSNSSWFPICDEELLQARQQGSVYKRNCHQQSTIPTGRQHQMKQDATSRTSDSKHTTIGALKNSKKPMLLTLTSFPFRVIYANIAYDKLVGRNKSVIGETFYAIFVNEQGPQAPTIATCPTLLGLFDGDDVVRVSSSSSEHHRDGSLFCKIKVQPVLKNSEDNTQVGVRYYAVALEEVSVDNKSTSIVYLPMPAGSMTRR